MRKYPAQNSRSVHILAVFVHFYLAVCVKSRTFAADLQKGYHFYTLL